jgi:hypothetical protein
MTLGGQYGCCVADMSCGDEKMRTAVVNDRIGRPVQQQGADGVAGF